MSTPTPTHQKITHGFVIQTYDGPHCISQEFIAGDPVVYEDMNGNYVDSERITASEVYQPFEMVQPESPPTDSWEVVVGNVGMVYQGNDEVNARHKYDVYVDLSLSGSGRVGGEPVHLYHNGEIVAEYNFSRE